MHLIERRIGLLFAGFLLLLGLALSRAVWLQTVQGEELRASANRQQTETFDVPGHRGTILDRNGKPLAVSEAADSVFATPYQVKDPVGLARRLSPILGVPEDKLVEKLADRGSGFAYLARKVPTSAGKAVERLAIEGLGRMPDTRRVYPQGMLASQVLGTVGVDNNGLSGLEIEHEGTLRGADGRRQIVKDALGEQIDTELVRETRRGRDMTLTLDATLQARTERVLGQLGQKFRPKGATAIVMDPRSSEVLALANWPRVDANQLEKAPKSALQNRATGFVYEPGSTFKAFTASAALEEGTVTPSTTFDLPPTIQVADRTIKESHERGYVSLSVAQILAQSSNIGSVKIGMALGGKRFDSWIRRFGFGRRSGIDYPGEEGGIVPGYRDYSGSTMGNLPIGQGLSVTPIQMAAGYAAIANGGLLRPPLLVREVAGRRVTPPRGKRVLEAKTARSVAKMLEGVLAPGGTASEVKVPGYSLAGKTGTAEKVIDGVYSKSKYVASFVGFAPARDPELLVAIVVDEPQGSIYGGAVAAPAFGEIATFALPHLGVRPR